jgi:aldose 1-epimerase
MRFRLPPQAGGARARLIVVQPSGEQLEIRHGGQRAVVVEQGGGIRAYEVDGVPVVDGYGVDEMAGGGRGQVLLPWPNRLHGRYAWDGREHAVPLDKPAEGNAMHGLVRWRSWRPAAAGPDSVTMTLRLLPQPAYPFALDLAVSYGLDDDGLTVTTSATNVGRDAAPYGHGAHPYLTVGTPPVDDVVLHVPADAWLETDEDQIPIGRRPVEGSAYDFRSPRPIGRAELDHAFTGLRRDPDGRASVELSAGDRRVVLWMDSGYPYVQVFTGDTLPAARRRQGLAVEPMTCPPDAFRSGQDLLRLEPGETATRQWGIRPSRAATA